MSHSTEQVSHSNHVGHVVPVPILAATWLVLMIFTWLTVAATSIDLGTLNIWLAMGIATVKASLVVLYFMHLRYDRPINAIVFVFALIFVMLFVVLALLDTGQYQPNLIPGFAPGMPPR